MSDATVSALRAGPSVPPQAPPQPSPLPQPQPSPRPEPTPEPTPDAGPDTTPAPRPSGDVRPPVGTPTDDAAPRPTPLPEPQPSPRAVPPPSSGVTAGGSCLASTVEIQQLPTSSMGEGRAFKATLRETDGSEITDNSCETMVWTVGTDHSSVRVFINYGPDSRFVTITGMSPGTYTIGATTPNAQSDTLVLVVDAP
jgi:hypothetical protein